MSDRHLLLGTLPDFITGDIISDTLDERARQKIAKFLVKERGFLKTDISSGKIIDLEVDGKEGKVVVDFLVTIAGKPFAVVIFGPGSILTRERPALSAARLLEDFEVPLTIVSNGEDVSVLDTRSGKVVAKDFLKIPSRAEANTCVGDYDYQPVSEKRKEKERRILFAFDVLAESECREFKCSIIHGCMKE